MANCREVPSHVSMEDMVPRGVIPSRRRGVLLLLLVCAISIVAISAVGQAAAATGDLEFFESRIRPLLMDRCLECHSVEKARKGGLLLDSRPGWQAGGDSGVVLVPGDPAKSRLVRAVHWTDSELRMPPMKAGGRLTDAQIADLEEWIRRGAPDPREIPAAASRPGASWDSEFKKRMEWWSLRPAVRHAAPAKVDPEWDSPVDRFLRARMKERGVNPSPLAGPETLLRRATMILTGLPPTVAELDRFLAEWRQNSTRAYESLVDRLLASPRYGERFARHWLDVVRYTETHGNEWNYDAPFAWRYRDYIVRAFNGDLPYPQWVREHVAGDLLPNPRWNRAANINESAIGTAFYRFGEVNHDSCVQFSVIGYDIVDNQLDTLTKAFQATTVACARCHDHKVDAVSSLDYHALLGVLRSSRSVMKTLDAPEVNQSRLTEMSGIKERIRVEFATLWQREISGLSADRMHGWLRKLGTNEPAGTDPLRIWKLAATSNHVAFAKTWREIGNEHARERSARGEFEHSHFLQLADFRKGMPAGWHSDGMGLRENRTVSGDFAVATQGDTAIRQILPSGVFTYRMSDRLNGALRSPTLRRLKGRVSFEVTGNRFSLARLVFNNCQFNYNHQHSIHHDDWSWITIDFPEGTDVLKPYAELLTYRDNPKFPDPLGTLGKDTENQRGPYDEHARDPRTWWGIRRIVAHDQAEVPRDDAGYLGMWLGSPAPESPEEAVERLKGLLGEAIEAFGKDAMSDDQVRWLNWILRMGGLPNRRDSTPQVDGWMTRYRDLEAGLQLPTTMPVLADEGEGFDQAQLSRGDFKKPGVAVPRGYIAALTHSGSRVDAGSGRRGLAEALADPRNPLTARVMVNRVWQWIYGRGLVGTPDDFGHLGETPSHPELLDDLSARWGDEGGSVKALVRQLVLTRAFRSSAVPDATAVAKDPDNRLLSHASARRAEAEVIRDSLLQVSGRMNSAIAGPSIHPYRQKADSEKRLFTGPLDGAGRRSLYVKFQLMESPHFLNAFNLPGGKVVTGIRERSNTPAQSLAMLNDPLVAELAAVWAVRRMRDDSRDVDSRLAGMFREAMGRMPSEVDLNRFRGLVDDLARDLGVPPASVLGEIHVWKDVAHVMFNLKEFIFIP